MFCTYKGDYDKENITLTEELDRKRIEKEKAEIILYKANYEVADSWNREVRETRVAKYVYDDGQIVHGIYNGIDIDGNEPNNLKDFNSTDMHRHLWRAESNVPSDANEKPCEIFIDGKCVNDGALKEWAANYDKTVEVTFTANIPEEKIGEIKVNRNKEDIRELKIKVLGDTQHSEDSRIYGYAPAELKLKDVEVTFKTGYENKDKFKYNGVEALQDCFPEMDLFDNVKVEENDKHIEHNANTEHYLTSPPPPLVDGVSIRINGLDDVTEREAKKYIDLVVQKVQESVRKNLSSISITKQEDGHIKLDYVLHHEPFERIRRITGYLVGSMDKWNNAKRSEEHERVKHIRKNNSDLGAPRTNKENAELEAITNSAMNGNITWEEADKQYYFKHLQIGDFDEALQNLYRGTTLSSDEAVDFMKDVVKEHGTDTAKLYDAVNAVANFNGEMQEFAAKLLQDTLNTDEYSKALEAEQGKTREYIK